MSVFATRNRRSHRKGYIKQIADGLYMALEYDSKSNKRLRITFDTYAQARQWIFARGLWVEL